MAGPGTHGCTCTPLAGAGAMIEGYFKEKIFKGRHFEDFHPTEKIYRTALCVGDRLRSV